MTVLALVKRPDLSLVSNRLVFSADDTGALQSATRSAQKLAMLELTREQSLEEARQHAHDEGYAAGFNEGLLAAQEAHAKTLYDLSESHEEALAELRNGATELAINIVRHIASRVGNAHMLAALASDAAEQLEPDVAVRVHVHPDVAEAVERQIGIWISENPDMSKQISIVPDPAIEQDGCQLVTEAGSLIADLETQLAVLRQRLASGNIRDSD